MKFNAQEFAKWMEQSFADSRFKTQTELVKAVKSNPATISRLMTGKSQYLTDKPSQPDKELIIRLAKEFGKNVDEALLLAGYAPNNTVLPEELAITGFDGLDKDDLKEIAAFISFKRQQKAMKEKENIKD